MAENTNILHGMPSQLVMPETFLWQTGNQNTTNAHKRKTKK